MKNLIIIFTCSLLFINCKRNHYYCVCSSPTYTKDWGTQFATRESDFKKDCDSHKVNANTICTLVAE